MEDIILRFWNEPSCVHPVVSHLWPIIFLALVRKTTEKICRSSPGALHFSSQYYFYPPSCQRVSAEQGGMHRKADLQGDFDWARAAWYTSLGQALPLCPLPLLPGREAWGKPTGGSSCWAPPGDLTLNSALCTSKSVHLDPANSDWVLHHQIRTKC